MITNFNEDFLQFIWEQQLFNKSDLKTTDGEPISIIKPGFLNRNSGPDFENCEIKIGNTTLFGAIEIHLEAKDWKLHAHQENEAYNTVILHVCLKAKVDAQRKDGTIIPNLELKDRLNRSSLNNYKLLFENKQFIPCENQITNVKNILVNSWLERLIVDRLEQRCAVFESFLQATNNWNQTFYIALVRAFGMPINTLGFEEIAAELPADIILKHSDNLFQLEALFFGVSGLLKDDFDSTYYNALQKEYSFLSKKYKLKSISCILKFGKMRPMSLPHVKIAQLAALFRKNPNLSSKVLRLPRLPDLQNLFDFDTSEYWLTHYNFAKSSKQRSKKMSKNAVELLLLNAIIPFAFYYEKVKLKSGSTHALDYLLNLSSEKNSIIDKWKSVGIDSGNALNSQALLHLYKSYCSKKLCLQCNIGRTLLLRD